jgi:hypothetical protein
MQSIDATMALRKSMAVASMDSLATVATTAGGAASQPTTLDSLDDLIVYAETLLDGDAEADQREEWVLLATRREATAAEECREFVGKMFPDAEPDSVLMVCPDRYLGADSLILLRKHFSAFGAVRVALVPKLSAGAQQQCAIVVMRQSLNDAVQMPRTQAIKGVQLEVRML